MPMVTKENILRTCIFRPYRKGCGPTFRLVMWDTHQTEGTGAFNKSVLGYRLTMYDKYTGPGCAPSYCTVLFEGKDFHYPHIHAIDSDDAVENIMGFLTLRPGDTDAEYFTNYTPEQLEYCSQHAEALSCEVQARFGREE